MMTDTLAFLLLLCALPSNSCRTKEYQRNIKGLEDMVKNCPKACNKIFQPECLCLNISSTSDHSYFNTGLIQMTVTNKEASLHCDKLIKRLKHCHSPAIWEDLQCQRLVSRKDFVEELQELFQKISNLRRSKHK